MTSAPVLYCGPYVVAYVPAAAIPAAALDTLQLAPVMGIKPGEACVYLIEKHVDELWWRPYWFSSSLDMASCEETAATICDHDNQQDEIEAFESYERPALNELTKAGVKFSLRWGIVYAG